MGYLLYLEMASESEEEGKAIILSRDFLDEIVRNLCGYFTHNDFLTKEEIQVLQPNECGEIRIGNTSKLTASKREEYLELLRMMMKGEKGWAGEREFLIEEGIISERVADRARDPLLLLTILRKIEVYMKKNAARLPVVHSIYISAQALTTGDDESYVMVNSVQCAVEGDLYHEDDYGEKRNKIRIKSYGAEGGKVDFYVQVEPVIEIGGVNYLTQTISKAEQYANDFEKVNMFLEQAFANNQKVLWEYC